MQIQKLSRVVMVKLGGEGEIRLQMDAGGDATDTKI
jgi:hypothetical protein